MPAAIPIHQWKFFRAGGLEQVRLETGSDLAALSELDQKLWVALSSPAKGLEFDVKTLELIDTDKDGRIRVPEIIAAARWAVSHLKDANELLKPSDALPLSSIDDSHEAGARLLAGAKRILENLGKSGAASLAVQDVADTARVFAATKFNGDGIVPADVAAEPEVQNVISEIITTCGPIVDRSGKPGVDAAKTTLFFTEAKALIDWHAAAGANGEITPFGDETPAAYAAFAAVRAKIDDYCARCEMAEFDSRATVLMNRAESELSAIAARDLTSNSDEIARLPLAQTQPGKPLPLNDAINPAWREAMQKFRTNTLVPFLGDVGELRPGDWASLKRRFRAHEEWLAARPKTCVEKLGVERLGAILQGNAREKILGLIAEDLRLEAEHNQIAAVDRLVRYYRDLYLLLRNFVNFHDFYDPADPAIFQTGTLYIDARSCELCVSVEDVAKHSTLANSAGIYLAYCEVTRVATNQKRNICAAITSGFAESLYVGRNGIFYDRAGRDWDATIIKIVEHQISLKEAFWSPWKKISRMVGDQINKMLAAREAAALSAAGKSIDEAGKAVDPAKLPPTGTPPPPATAPNSGAAMASSVAAIGIAVGILGTAVGKLMEFVKDATLLNIVIGVLCVVGAVSLPSVLIAYFKLRKRDIAPILNACGWAINRRIRLTLKLGRMLTKEAKLPPGAHRTLRDPYAEETGRRDLVVALLILLLAGSLWYMGRLDSILPANMRSTAVLGTNAPAALRLVEPAVTNSPSAR